MAAASSNHNVLSNFCVNKLQGKFLFFFLCVCVCVCVSLPDRPPGGIQILKFRAAARFPSIISSSVDKLPLSHEP